MDNTLAASRGNSLQNIHSVSSEKTILYGGPIIRNGKDYPDGNIHGLPANRNGQWHVFYHRMTHNTIMSRKAVIIEAGGGIKDVEQTSQQAGFSGPGITQNQIGVDKEKCSTTVWLPNYSAGLLISIAGISPCRSRRSSIHPPIFIDKNRLSRLPGYLQGFFQLLRIGHLEQPSTTLTSLTAIQTPYLKFNSSTTAGALG
jgi:hypothetical protein